MKNSIKHITSSLQRENLLCTPGNNVRGLVMLVMLASVTALTGCLKEDEPIVLPSPATGAQVFSVNIGSNYNREVYFSLGNKDSIGNEVDEWDFAFESTTNGTHVYINGGFGVRVSQSYHYDMDAIHDTTGCAWRYDNPSWDLDSTAIGNWQNAIGNPVYVIDRSLCSPGNPADRFWKIKINHANATEYSLSYARLADSTFKTVLINKTANHTYSYFTFNNNGHQLDVEPEKDKWDIVFTRYRYIFYEYLPPLVYYVNGVLLNTNLTMAAVDSVTPYQDIDYNFAKTKTLSPKRDAIGYDWKIVNTATGHYTVKPYYVYIIKDQDGYYYKLHFIDFYSATGTKGEIKFEYQRL